jgi:hypothetical protein
MFGSIKRNVTKEFILKEIKRTAWVNGGKPLGHQRFYQETGIKLYDWRGKLWGTLNQSYLNRIRWHLPTRLPRAHPPDPRLRQTHFSRPQSHFRPRA